MAIVTRVNGSVVAPSEQLGRKLEWVLDTAAVDAATLAVAVATLQQVASITIIGASSAAGTAFGCEGVGTLAGTQSLVTLTGATLS
jgi:hypothetical protein